jgi:hypothetical protein
LSEPAFCRHCGTPLTPDIQFCPKCGKEVTLVLPPGQPQFQVPMSSQTATVSSDKIWGIDKRFIIVAILFLVVILPVFPHQKTIMVDGQTMTTQVTQIASFTTVTQSVQSGTQTSIPVYVGYVRTVPDAYYSYYGNYYRNCFWRYGRIYCYYNYWPYYNTYINTVTVSASDRIVSISDSQGPNGLEILTLTSYDGNVRTIQNVIDASNLSQTGTTTVSGTTIVANTIVNTLFSPTTVAFPVDCKQCVQQTVTEHISILQWILGGGR